MSDQTEWRNICEPPQSLDTRGWLAAIIREHWVQNWEDPRYPSAVRCMKDGCTWKGRFPGDIADHNVDLIMDYLAKTRLL